MPSHVLSDMQQGAESRLKSMLFGEDRK